MKKILLWVGAIICLGVVTVLGIGFYGIWEFESKLVQHDRYESKAWSVKVPKDFIPMLENRDLLVKAQPGWKKVFELAGDLSEGWYLDPENPAQYLSFSSKSDPLMCSKYEKNYFDKPEIMKKLGISAVTKVKLGGREWIKYHRINSNNGLHSVSLMTCSANQNWSVDLSRMKKMPDRIAADNLQSLIGEAKLAETQN